MEESPTKFFKTIHTFKIQQEEMSDPIYSLNYLLNPDNS